MDKLSFTAGLRAGDVGTGVDRPSCSLSISSPTFHGSSTYDKDGEPSSTNVSGTMRRAEASVVAEAEATEAGEHVNATSQRADENLLIARFLEQLLGQQASNQQSDHVASSSGIDCTSTNADTSTDPSPFAIETQRDSFAKQQKQDVAMMARQVPAVDEMDCNMGDEMFDACVDFTIDAEGMVSLWSEDEALTTTNVAA